jgi:hypothetical protein
VKRAVLIDRVRRALGAGPSTGRRCLCPPSHTAGEHDDIRGCTHAGPPPCMCPASPQTVTNERAGDNQ